MMCDRVQAELSRGMDEDLELSSDSSRHVATCVECAEFRETSIEIERRYANQVRAGIDRLRPMEKPRARRTPWLVPLAAALLLCWWSAEPKPSIPQAVAVAPAAHVRIWPIDEAGLTFISIRDVLPVRLHQEFLPEAQSVSEITLPRDLRF